MSEISKPFPAAPTGPSKASPVRDPRRSSRQENTGFPPSISNVPARSTIPKQPKSYGEKLIENITNLSAEVSITAALTNEYSKAKRAQKGINQHFEKLRNLNQFPAAKDLVNRIRDAQNIDVSRLEEQLTSRKENQKNIAKSTAALVDTEVKGKDGPSDTDTIKYIEAETKSAKLSVQTVKEDLYKLKRDTVAVGEKKYTELQKFSESQSEELKLLKRSQNEDFAMLRRTRDKLNTAFSEIDDLKTQIQKSSDDTSTEVDRNRLSKLDVEVAMLKRSLENLLQAKIEKKSRQNGDSRDFSTEVEQENLKTRLNALEKTLPQYQSKQSNADWGILTDKVNDAITRLEAIEEGKFQVSSSEPNPPAASIVEKYEYLKSIIDKIIETQAMRDDMLAAAIEENQKKQEQQLEEIIGNLKQETASDIETAVLEVKNKNTYIDSLNFAGLKEASEVHDQRLQTVETAIGSLEMRYGHVTSEALVLEALPLIQRTYPPPAVLHNLVERFHTLNAHISQVLNMNIPHLASVVDGHSQQLAALHSHVLPTNDGAGINRNSAAIHELQMAGMNFEQRLAEVQRTSPNFKEIENKVSSFIKETNKKYDDTQKILDGIRTERNRMTEDISSMFAFVTELKSPPRDHIALSNESQAQVQYVDQKLSSQVEALERQLQDLKQKIDNILQSKGLDNEKLQLEDFEVVLQPHVEHLTHQITQLENRQNQTVSELSGLRDILEKIDRPGRLTTQFDNVTFNAKLESLASKMHELEQIKETLKRRLRRPQSPGSPSSLRNNESINPGASQQENEPRDTASTMSPQLRSVLKHKNKRRRSKLSTSASSSQDSTPSGDKSQDSSSQDAPQAEQSESPALKKRQISQSSTDVAGNAGSISTDK